MQLRRDLQDACALRVPQEASPTGGSFTEASAPEAPSDMDAGALCLLHQSSVSTTDSYHRVLQYDMTTTGDGGAERGEKGPEKKRKSRASREFGVPGGCCECRRGGCRESYNLSYGMTGRLAAVTLLSATASKHGRGLPRVVPHGTKKDTQLVAPPNHEPVNPLI